MPSVFALNPIAWRRPSENLLGLCGRVETRDSSENPPWRVSIWEVGEARRRQRRASLCKAPSQQQRGGSGGFLKPGGGGSWSNSTAMEGPIHVGLGAARPVIH